MSCHEHEACLRASSPAFRPRAAKAGLLQRRCPCGGSAGLDDECEECRAKKLQRGKETQAAGPRASGAQAPEASGRLEAPGQDFGRLRVNAEQPASATQAPAPGGCGIQAMAQVKKARGLGTSFENLKLAEKLRCPRLPTPPSCKFDVKYDNERTINYCRKGSCGGAIQFEIVGVTASGPGCPSTLAGLEVTEHVTSDGGCVTTQPVTGNFTLGPGGKPPPAVDNYGLCFPKDMMTQPRCVQKMTQKLCVGGMLADTRTITFAVTRDFDLSAPEGMNCPADITIS